MNIYFLTKIIKNKINIEDKTYTMLQHYLTIQKPDKLFKTYYDSTVELNKQNLNLNKVITIEFNENYNNYHAGKACMSDIINNLNHSDFSKYMKYEEEPKLIYKNGVWNLNTKSINIDLSKKKFKNIAVNFHINYDNLKQIAENVKRIDLNDLTKYFKNLDKINKNKYIVYNIYDSYFYEEEMINIKTWSDYINKCLIFHYKQMNLKNGDKNDNSSEFSSGNDKNNNIINIITSFNKISRKYSYIFKNNELILYSSTSKSIILPNPDGLIVNGEKLV